MAFQRLPTGTTAPPSLDHLRAAHSTRRSLLFLPQPVVELVFEHLPLCDQLSECFLLCKACPPPTAATIRHASPLSLTNDTVLRISHSPRLLELLTNATSVVLLIDTPPRVSRALQFVLSSPNGRLLFPHLASFTVRVSVNIAVEDASERVARLQADGAARDDPLSLLPLLPFLSARCTTLRSLRIVHPNGHTVCMEVSSLLAPLTALRRLFIAASLSVGNIAQLLTLPLELLDLHDSELNWDDTPRPLTHVPAPAAYRVLRLPRPWQTFIPHWGAQLHGITKPISHMRPHTLSFQTTLSDTTAEQIIQSPPSRSLALAVDTQTEALLLRAAATSAFLSAPRQLHLSVACSYWTHRTAIQPFFECVRCYQGRLRSLTLNLLPRSDELTSELLLVVAQCQKLQWLQLSTAGTPNRSYTAEVRKPTEGALWSGQPLLTHLHSLTLVGMREAEATVCRLLFACPVLRVCSLDVLFLSVGTLRILASSCPLLSHLQLRISDESVLATTARVNDERPSPAASFRSLLKLDLHYTAWSRTRPRDFPAVMSGLALFLVHSPLRQLHVALRFAVRYEAALQSLLGAAPRLQRLRVASGEWEADAAAPGRLMTGAWEDEADNEADREADDEVDEKQAAEQLPAAALTLSLSNMASPAPVLPPSFSSVDVLDLLVSPAALPVEQFAALLAHCPAATAIKLSIHDADGALLTTFLHCLAHIGVHCPIIQRITFELHSTKPTKPGMDDPGVRVFDEDEVRDVVNAYELPEHAFAHLRYVCEVGAAVQVLNEEAAGYVRRRWLRHVWGVAVLDWHTPPLPQ